MTQAANLAALGTNATSTGTLTPSAISDQNNASTGYFDLSAGTTSSTTYTVYYANYQGSGTFGLQWNGGPSTLTLMEIAA